MARRSSIGWILLLAAAAAGCNQASFGGKSSGSKGGNPPPAPAAQPSGGSEGRPTEGDESLPGYLLNLNNVQMAATPDGKATVTAPAGTFQTQSANATVSAWETSPEALAAKVIVTNGVARVPGTLLGTLTPDGTGAFQGSFAYGGSGLLVVAVEADPANGVFFVPKANKTAAAYKDPLKAGPPAALTFQQVAPAAQDSSSSSAPSQPDGQSSDSGTATGSVSSTSQPAGSSGGGT